MVVRLTDGSEVVLDRATMVRCEAIWQIEAEKGTAEAPEPPMPGIRKLATNEDPLVKAAVAKLLELLAMAEEDAVDEHDNLPIAEATDTIREVLRLLDPTALSLALEARTDTADTEGKA